MEFDLENKKECMYCNSQQKSLGSFRNVIESMEKIKILSCTAGCLFILDISSYSGGITTEEHLEKIIKTSEEIKRYKEFLKSFNRPYRNEVVAHDWNDDRNSCKYLLLEDEPELENLIRDYVTRKIEVLEKKFAEL